QGQLSRFGTGLSPGTTRRGRCLHHGWLDRSLARLSRCHLPDTVTLSEFGYLGANTALVLLRRVCAASVQLVIARHQLWMLACQPGEIPLARPRAPVQHD